LQSYQTYLATNDVDHRWERLASHRPALTVFWYRQHQDYLEASSFGSFDGGGGHVNKSEPPLIVQGMVTILLNANGLLEELAALPPARSRAAAGRALAGEPVDWSGLLKAAGLDEARLTPSPSEAFIPVSQNSSMAWTGTYGDGRPDTITVDAAALDGRPVFFRIRGPWTEPAFAETSLGQRIAYVSQEALLIALMVAAALVAWRNVRLGRGDQKAAWRVAGVPFAAGVASWALVASHVPTQWEVYLLVMGLSWASFQGGFVGLVYLAIEPFVRRYWPDALISWVRMVNGRARDPLVTSHLLVGVFAGLATTLLVSVRVGATNALLSAPNIGVSVTGARYLFGLLLSDISVSIFLTTGWILTLVLLRSVVRRTWMADVLFVVLLTSVLYPPSPATIPVLARWLMNAFAFATMVWVLRRFGLLALAAMSCTNLAVRDAPRAVASWYAAYSLTTPLLFAAVAAWSLYVILTSRPGHLSRSTPEPLA
jgi:hypothetical protein